MIRRGRMRWSRGVAPLQAIRNVYKVWVRETKAGMHTIVAVKSLFMHDERMVQCDADPHAQTTLQVGTSQHAHIADAVQTRRGNMHHAEDIILVHSKTDAAIWLDHCIVISILL